MTTSIHRTSRSRVLLTVVLAAGLALSACATAAQTSTAGNNDQASGNSSAATSSVIGSASDAAAATGEFPVTIPSIYGDLTFQEAPTKIVALTSQIADILVSLGVQPIAVAMSEEDISRTSPWLEGQLTGSLDPALLTTDGAAVNVEKVLGYEPDLVVGDSWQIADQSVYDTLSVVAPTWAGAEKGNVDWDQQTIALAEIIGQPEKATQLIADVDAMYEESRSQLPGLAGKTYQFTRFATTEGFAFGNGSWLEEFGLVPAPTQDNSMQSPGISMENLDQLNADVLAIWAYDNEQQLLEADPRFAALPSTKAGQTIWADLKLAYATNGPGPLSLAYANEVVTPILAAADGANG